MSTKTTKVNVNIRLDKKLKEEAQKLAKKKGTNLSTILNMYLVDFTQTGKIKYLGDNDAMEVIPFTKKEKEEVEKLSNFKSLMNTFSGI